MALGFEAKDLEESRFFETEKSIGLGELKQANTLIYYDKNGEKRRSFGGIRIDGLISHAFLSNYSWTIDFDKHQYIFGVNN